MARVNLGKIGEIGQCVHLTKMKGREVLFEILRFMCTQKDTFMVNVYVTLIGIIAKRIILLENLVDRIILRWTFLILKQSNGGWV